MGKKDILKYVYCRHVAVSNYGIELNKQFEKIKKLQCCPEYNVLCIQIN